jgi:F-type H+-transporting ATPase subunit a
MSNPFEHVQDSEHWHIFDQIGGGLSIPLPSFNIFGHHFVVTKFMWLELIAAILAIAIFVPLCRRASAGALPRGPWWNAFESLLTFIRDQVAKPTLGEHEADRYIPFLWTLFVFILFCNLLGMIPWMGSPTASISVTGALAACSFIVINGAAIAKMGLVPYLKSLWPHFEIDMPGGAIISAVIGSMIYVIEVISSVIKCGVLAIRLFANMFAGHVVLGIILAFIPLAASGGLEKISQFLLFGTVSLASVLGVVALSLLELFVAFLHAYIFTFLTSLFMGMSLHPAH